MATDPPPSFTKVDNPSNLPANHGYGVAWGGTRDLLAVAHISTPFITVYDWNGSALVKLDNPASLPPQHARSVAWSSDDRFLAVGHSESPYITVYERNETTLTALGAPAETPGAHAWAVAWSPDDTLLAVGSTSLVEPDTPDGLTVYAFDGESLTRVSDLSALATSVRGVAWSPDGGHLAVADVSSPHLKIFERDGTSFTKIDDPAELPGSAGEGVAWSDDGEIIAIVHVGSPRVSLYEWRDGDPVRLSNPSGLPGDTSRGVAWSHGGGVLTVTSEASPHVFNYARDGVAFTRLADPDTNPPNIGRDAAWSMDNSMLAVAHDDSPYVTVYNTTGVPPPPIPPEQVDPPTLFASDGPLFGGNQSALASSLGVSVPALTFGYGLLWSALFLVAGAGIARSVSDRLIAMGAAAGGAAGVIFSFAVGWFPLWFLLLLGLVIVAFAGLLLRRGGGV